MSHGFVAFSSNSVTFAASVAMLALIFNNPSSPKSTCGNDETATRTKEHYQTEALVSIKLSILTLLSSNFSSMPELRIYAEERGESTDQIIKIS